MNPNTRLGYCCINIQLSKLGILTNRTIIKRHFIKKGITHCSYLALKNVEDLAKIIEWNIENNIGVYRISSNLIPWMSEYELSDLPNFDLISIKLNQIGELIKNSNMRISMHPGQFNVLCSPTPGIVANTVKELNQHAQILDLLGLPKNHMYPINIHIGGSYNDKPETAKVFCKNFDLLSDSTKARLIIENDDKPSQYSVKELYDLIWKNIFTPITFDYHHHRFNDSGLTEFEALSLASTTWDCKQLVHYSSCKKTFEDFTVNARAHADYLYEVIHDYGFELDIEIEAKLKELAIFEYSKKEKLNFLFEKYLPFDDKSVFETN